MSDLADADQSILDRFRVVAHERTGAPVVYCAVCGDDLPTFARPINHFVLTLHDVAFTALDHQCPGPAF